MSADPDPHVADPQDAVEPHAAVDPPAVRHVERSASRLRTEAMAFLRAFGLASAVWSSLLAFAAPGVERAGVMWTAIALTWVWALASQRVAGDRMWWSGWLVVAVMLEVAAPLAGTGGWSLTGGALILVMFGVVLSGRRPWIVATVVVLVLVALSRGLVSGAWSLASAVATTLFLAFGALALTWLVERIQAVVTQRDALQAQLLAAETATARATERAEAGARLHDTVLQHLTAVGRAADLEQARRHAGRASNDLRLFLRTGSTDATSLRTLLQQHLTAAADGAEVSVAVVGDRAADDRGRLLVQSAGEAVRNAVTHGRPPVRVLAELGHEVVVFVGDHGDGFDIATIPAHRLGVNDSIIARMRRAGGSATLHTGDTTEWELRLFEDPESPVARQPQPQH